MNNEFEAQLKALLYSQQSESINLAVELAKGLGVDLKALIKSWGLNPFGIVWAEDFLEQVIIGSHKKISNLRPLIGLGGLVRLFLYGCKKIANLSALKNLTQIEVLDLNYNQIADLSPLSKLNNLQYLYLEHNQISDLRALSNLSKLHTLCLDFNQISDLAPLANLNNLKFLSCEYNPIADFSPIQHLVDNGLRVSKSDPAISQLFLNSKII